MYVLNERESGLEMIKRSRALISQNLEAEQEQLIIDDNAHANYKDMSVAFAMVGFNNRSELGTI